MSSGRATFMPSSITKGADGAVAIGAVLLFSVDCTSPLSSCKAIHSPPVKAVFSCQVPSVRSGGLGLDAEVLEYKTNEVAKSPSPSSARTSQRFNVTFQAILNSQTPKPGQGWSPFIGFVWYIFLPDPSTDSKVSTKSKSPVYSSQVLRLICA